MLIVQGQYTETSDEDKNNLFRYLNGLNDHNVTPYNGEINVVAGVAQSGDYTVINARSLAENVRYSIGAKGEWYSGRLAVEEGKLKNQTVIVSGDSLVHSATLTTIAFTRGFFGDYGQYIVSIGLLLFAFSTAIAWSYYGDRAMIYLMGPRSVMPYRVIYVAGFVWASFSDTTLVWTFSAVAIVVMTLPNLFGILLLRKEMKETVDKYWDTVKRN